MLHELKVRESKLLLVDPARVLHNRDRPLQLVCRRVGLGLFDPVVGARAGRKLAEPDMPQKRSFLVADPHHWRIVLDHRFLLGHPYCGSPPRNGAGLQLQYCSRAPYAPETEPPSWCRAGRGMTGWRRLLITELIETGFGDKLAC